MAMTKFVFLVIAAFGILHMTKELDALSLTISPEKCIGTIQNHVEISCRRDVKTSQDAALIEIRRNDEDALAFLRECNNLTLRNDMWDKIQATGFINKETGESNLNITLRNPRTEDTGIYTCLLYYLDEAGNLLQEKSSANLAVEKLDVLSLEESLNILKKRILDLETNLQEKDNELKKTISVVGENSKKQIIELKKEVTYNCAFSATNDGGSFELSGGQTVIFPDLKLNHGDGYNVSTGVFTAKKAGLYGINLVVRKHRYDQHLRFDVRTKTGIAGQLSLWDSNNDSQSSFSVLVDLQVGENVRVVLSYHRKSLYIHGNHESIFSGYLIRPL